jgi:hypothetical protein
MALQTTDTLIIAGSNKPTDIEALKAIYGAGATVRVAKNFDDIVGILKSYSSINRLVVGTHGSEGDVIIAGVHIPINKLASAIRASTVRPLVTETVVFDGCNVAGESDSLVKFMEALSAPKLKAFATSHLWWFDDYVLPKGTDPNALADLQRRYESSREYVVAGQPRWADMVKRGGRIRVWYEGFSRTLRERPRSDSEKRMVVPRSKLETIRTGKKDTGALSAQSGRPAGPMLQIEISGP